MNSSELVPRFDVRTVLYGYEWTVYSTVGETGLPPPPRACVQLRAAVRGAVLSDLLLLHARLVRFAQPVAHAAPRVLGGVGVRGRRDFRGAWHP